METETLIASYEPNKNEHIGDERMDVVPNDAVNSPQKNEDQESSETIDKSNKDCGQTKLGDNVDESEDEHIDQVSERIEADSDEDCEEEEKLLLSPTHSDKEYDTDEEEDRDHLSAEENGGVEDSDDEDDKLPSKGETEKCENEDEANKSPMQEESEQTSVTHQVDVNDKTDAEEAVCDKTGVEEALSEEIDGKSDSNEAIDEKVISVEEPAEKAASIEDENEKAASIEEIEEEAASIEETDSKAASVEETDSKVALIEETDLKAASVEETGEEAASVEETGDETASVEETGDETASVEGTGEEAASVEETGEEAASIKETEEKVAINEITDEKVASNEETIEKSASDVEDVSEKVPGQENTEEDHVEAVMEVDPLEETSGTVEKGDTDDPLAAEDKSDPLVTEDDVKIDGKAEEATVILSVDDNKNEEEKDKKDMEKLVPDSSETSEATEVEDSSKKSEDTKEENKTSGVILIEDEASRRNDPLEDGTEANAEKIEGEKSVDCPLLKESLTKPSDVDSSKEIEGDDDIEMDEDFDPSLLCPELSMEVDEAPVITENDSAAPENDGNKSPLRLYEPIFSTFVDEITGAEVDFQLTQEELKLREQTYGEKNPIQFTKIHCTACNVHLGSALDGQGNRFVHPLLKVLICKKCYHFYTSGEFEKDEDGSELYCRWCGQGGQVMCCSNCEMVFCKKCIRINFDRKKIAAIRDSDEWLCFRCNPSQLMHLRIHCSEFMEYVHREIGNVPSLENPAAALTTDYCQCCIPHKKRAVEPSSSEPKKKRKKVSEDPDYDPVRDQESPPPEVVPAAVLATAAAPAAGKTPPIAARPVVDAAKSAVQTGTLQKMGHVPANAAFRTTGPGHQPRPRVQVLNQGQGIRSTSSPGYIKILPGGVRVPGAAPNRLPTPNPPALRALRPNAPRPIRPSVPQMKHEWFEKTVRAAARVNSNLSYTLTQLNRAQASATSVEALAVVHNKLQEILSTSINSLIQIRKNLRTEFIAGIKNIRFPPKPQTAQQSSSSAGQDDDVIFVSPATSPVPPPLASPSSLPAAALNLPSSVTLTKKASPSAPKPGPSSAPRPGPSGVSRPGPSGVSRPGPSGVTRPGAGSAPRPGPSGFARQGLDSQPKPGPSGVSRNSLGRNDQGNGPKSFLRVKSFSALQNVTSECITIPDDPVPEEKTTKIEDDDDDDVTVIEKKVEIVTIIDDSPMKSPDKETVDNPDGAKKNLSAEEIQSNGVANESDDEDSEKSKKTGVSIDHLDPVEKMKILNTKILLRRSTEIEELVKTKFGLLNGDASN